MSRLFRHGVVPSTNELALEAIAAGQARHEDVHVAEGQTSGRGRRGNPWHSPAGEGLYVSVVLLSPPPPPEPAGLTIAAGLAAYDAVASLGLANARLKWPNDLLVGGAKLAGILVEARSWEPERPAFVVGLGLNVHQRDFDPALRAERAVTSLALEGVHTERDTALRHWLEALAGRRRELDDTPATLLQAYLTATGLGGRRVRVRRGDAWHEGLLEALELGDGLRLQTAEGVRSFPLPHVTAVEAL